ncbi:bile acid:sodium symporter family protein [Lacihabitans soyangensis]|uniref:Bile acid:sodium symporter family protein n=1 Tax=Lacihabitans soyangensis TaxID=869394 RepID=A0AAE3KRK1_9BACT|nr:bile acid:sodium symporter family protein [Lacihabitans soyangensis]MCP9762203.1 bile acid:sodium symporter family protein [Lacihabitans soyangensis]
MKKYIYPFSIILIVIVAYNFPDYFVEYNGVKFNKFIIPILQVIMLGMGSTITEEDFMAIVKTPKLVVIGLVAQFMIMPLLGFGLTKVFDFPVEIAAGLVLIGCSPSGLASNVMAMLAKANLALSICITTMATLLAPILTPLLMKTLGGELIEIKFLSMVWDMTKIVILPVVLGVLANRFFPVLMAKIKNILPCFSMVGIGFIIIIVTASGQKSLETVGGLLLLAVFIHNVGGYLLGYFSAKLLKLKEKDARAIALEVGMQNGGLASALANELGKLATVGLASAIFGPMMNISGSLLASWWGTKKNND